MKLLRKCLVLATLALAIVLVVDSAEDSGNQPKKQDLLPRGVEFHSKLKRGRSDLIDESTKLGHSQMVRVRERFPVKFCELDRDTGVICPGLSRGIYAEQYYYDPETDRCTHFIYNGCGGNANRFMTVWQCRQVCGRSERENLSP